MLLTLSLSLTHDQPEKCVGRAARKGSVTTDGILTTASPITSIHDIHKSPWRTLFHPGPGS
jgi:hypothetical protein